MYQLRHNDDAASPQPLECANCTDAGAARTSVHPTDITNFMTQHSGSMHKPDPHITIKLQELSETGCARIRCNRRCLNWTVASPLASTLILVFVLSGAAVVNDVPVQAGEYLIVPESPSSIHAVTNAAENELLVLTLPQSKVLSNDAEFSTMTAKSFLSILPVLGFIMGLTHTNFAFPLSESGRSHAQEEFEFFLHRSLSALLSPLLSNVGNRQQVYEDALRMLQDQHADKTLNARTIAQHLKVSERKIHAIFHERRVSISVTLRDLRTQAAVRLRATVPHLNSAQIAEHVGFGSESALYRALRTHTRQNPSALS